MKPLFTIHEGEFLVGDHISRRLSQKFDVWVPTKDSGIDLLVTQKQRRGRAVALQVKFSRGYDVPESLADSLVATSWFKLNPEKIRSSEADLWVFVIVELGHKKHFVIVPTRELQRRIPNNVTNIWYLYFWITANRLCFQVRDLDVAQRADAVLRGVCNRHYDFTHNLENWELIDEFVRK